MVDTITLATGLGENEIHGKGGTSKYVLGIEKAIKYLGVTDACLKQHL